MPHSSPGSKNTSSSAADACRGARCKPCELLIAASCRIKASCISRLLANESSACMALRSISILRLAKSASNSDVCSGAHCGTRCAGARPLPWLPVRPAHTSDAARSQGPSATQGVPPPLLPNAAVPHNVQAPTGLSCAAGLREPAPPAPASASPGASAAPSNGCRPEEALQASSSHARRRTGGSDTRPTSGIRLWKTAAKGDATSDMSLPKVNSWP
mmetsp:Transcript_2406/g.6848  ORF Transcript_2406/g.6848 Transcript_2406/m.6848 type:complete len:216 (+) Transcript_2406:63-710(+)